jgi:acyl carrier protein
MSRVGLAPLSSEQALRLFDDAMVVDQAVVVAARLDPGALGDSAAGVPPLLSELVTRPTRRLVAEVDTGVSVSGLVSRLHGLSAEQRHSHLTELVCSNAGTVLGRGVAEIDPHSAFQDLGFDSLTAVELRNRLKTATGLTLAPTVIFDHPTPAALAEQIDQHLASTVTASDNEPELLARFNDIARELQTLINQPGWKSDDKTQLSTRLQTILTDLSIPTQTQPAIEDDDIAAATESQLFAILDEEPGT